MSKVLEKFHVSIRGEGDSTVVFANGFGTTQGIWNGVIEALGPGYRVVTFDHAGACPATLGAYQASRHGTQDGYAEDLLAVLESLDAGRVAYVGHSFSGMIGVLAASVEPGPFERMVLVGASARYLDDLAGGYRGGLEQAMVDQVLRDMDADYASWVNGFSQAFMGNPERPDFATTFADSLRALRPDIAASSIAMILQSDHREACRRYASLDIPTLVMQTAHDLAVPAEASHWLSTALGARRVELDVTGHFPHLVAPGLVARHLRNFLS